MPKKIIFSVTSIIIGLLLIEGIARVGYILLKKPLDLSRYTIPPPESLYHPYLGWEDPSNSSKRPFLQCQKDGIILIDENGFSRTPFAEYKSPEFKIAVLGGSTIWGSGSATNATTVPSILERLINEQSGIKTEVYNIGVSGYTSFQEMLKFYEFLQKFKADMVIVVSGVNDFRQSYDQDNDRYGFLSNHLFKTVDFIRKSERGEVIIANLGINIRSRSVAIDYMIKLINEIPRYKEFKKAQYKKSVQNPLSDIPERVETTNVNYSMINAMAKYHDMPFIMFLQPAAVTKEPLTQEESECFKPKPKYVKFHRTYFDQFAALNKDYTFFDLSQSFNNNEQTFFVDSCHYNDAGAQKLAEIVYSYIEPTIRDIMVKKQQE